MQGKRVWQHSYPPLGGDCLLFSYTMSVCLWVLPSSALGPLRGPCPRCMVMATVVIDKVNTVAERNQKEEKNVLLFRHR
jgi:hypothetical protein